jgi:diguanylate cyclase (GGDEF)-like protein
MDLETGQKRANRSLADPKRAQEMVRRGRFATQVAIVFTLVVLIGVPVLTGTPQAAVAGTVMLGVLVLSLRFTERQATAYAICLQLVYCLGLAGLVHAVFVLGANPVITVYFPPIVVLGCAYILGWRAAIFWTVPCLATMAAAVYLPKPPPAPVDPDMDFAVRVGALLTVLAFAVSFRRSHDRQAAELADLAETDALTGLSNRLALEGSIDRALMRAERFGRRSGLVYIDLDDMKMVNDTHGHDIGDAYLREIATRIRSVSRSYDTLARLGGDEFVVLLSETADLAGTRAYAEKLIGVLSEPVYIEGTRLEPKASIGFACYPEHGENAGALLGAADAAMYAAKQGGGHRVHAASAVLAPNA